LVIRKGWDWRVELVAIVAVLAGWVWLRNRVGDGGAQSIALGLMTMCVVWPWLGRQVLAVEHRARLRRRWSRACRMAKLETFNERIPRIMRQRRMPAGEELRVRLPGGQCPADLEAVAGVLAAGLKVREVQIEADPDNARYATVRVIRCDPLAGTVAIPWPYLNVERLSLWEPIPVGVDEHGQPVTITLPERNLLLGGEPGSGKSVAASLVVAAAALDPDAELTLLDGKQVELAIWRDCAQAFVGPDPAKAIRVLRRVQAEMERRYGWLAERSKGRVKRKIDRADGLPLHLVVCDELAFYLNIDDRKQRDELRNLFRDLVARGRAAGIILVAATQKPSGDVIPTALRDLFGFRWALRCSTRDASDTVLGAGWASLGYDASQIAGDQRGVGWLLAEDGQPERLRSYYLADGDLEVLAARADTLRRDSDAPRCRSCGVVIDLDDYRIGV
jgi:hypothetical protein